MKLARLTWPRGRRGAKRMNRYLFDRRKEERRMLDAHDRFWNGRLERHVRTLAFKLTCNAIYGKFGGV